MECIPHRQGVVPVHLGGGKIEIQQQIGIKLVLTSTTAYYNNWTSGITHLT